MLAWGALFAITIGLLIKRRWLEVASLMIGAGLVPTVGYLIVGPPDPRPEHPNSLFRSNTGRSRSPNSSSSAA